MPLTIVYQHITKMNVDVTASADLKMGGGVCSMIFPAVGESGPCFLSGERCP